MNNLKKDLVVKLLLSCFSYFSYKKKEKEVNFPESDVFWKEYDDYLISTPCSHYHTRKDVQFKLRSSNKKGVGIVEKEN